MEPSFPAIPSKQIHVQSQQYKQQKQLGNMFKVYNKDTRMTSMTSL